ncbi:hypothetical protein CAC42_6263 [Sphaceloma murrayae]|uniref:SprT-like domain-containing protein n=1 Tax=Sphaceloma murrayae TaxID=2082308 RepID=A0A2K1QTP7_9PEZI|nr:hypothetical protein CAC42_6263 [Sphaceloma murrayae]
MTPRMPTTDEDAAIAAIDRIASPSDAQQESLTEVKKVLGSDDPFVDVHVLFGLYNTLYFRSLLTPQTEVTWSPRLTLCAGICELVKNDDGQYKKIKIKISEPLLKLRPRSDVINTLLHEMIHAYLFITTTWRHSRGDDGSGHGSGFLLLADAINDHGNYQVTIYHTFHDEVDSYRRHIWRCDGPCQSQPPFFGLVKRSMNRAPGKGDSWFKRHADECGGCWTKIAEPEMTKEQVMRLNGLQRAGKQDNKLDRWVTRGVAKRQQEEEEDEEDESGPEKAVSKRCRRAGDYVECPVCGRELHVEIINSHLDNEHTAGSTSCQP